MIDKYERVYISIDVENVKTSEIIKPKFLQLTFKHRLLSAAMVHGKLKLTILLVTTF